MPFIPDEDRGADAPRDLTLAEAIDSGDARKVLAAKAALRRRAVGVLQDAEPVQNRPMTPVMLEGWSGLR